MQFVQSPAGDEVAVMRWAEVLIVEQALSRYAMMKPDSNIAARMVADVSRVVQEREARMEDEAEAGSTWS
ncbi:hypothetical protein ACFU99_19080 [Streptomyces sp. NPDC057654]|uniref:hypothetical protein n=1 Tax=Streptomyces sp. NPDC057654 TaxID=3346196 RepID=UPI003686D787